MFRLAICISDALGSGWFQSNLGESNPAQMPAVNLTQPQYTCNTCKYHRTQPITIV